MYAYNSFVIDLPLEPQSHYYRPLTLEPEQPGPKSCLATPGLASIYVANYDTYRVVHIQAFQMK